MALKEIKTICICGGGSLGIVCAGVFLSKGIEVNILTGHSDRWCEEITVYDSAGDTFGGKLKCVSNEPSDVIPQADLVFLTLPGFMIEETLKKIKPHLSQNTIVGSVVSSTGFFFFAHKIFGKEHVLLGFQRVPFIARQREYGKFGDLLGYKKSLNVAIENAKTPELIIEELKNIFNTPINLLDNFYEASLSNSNPILHTGRLYSMWKDYNGEVFEKQSLFYSDWTDEASEYMIMMDEEFQSLLRKLHIRENAIPSLLDYYESKDASSLTQKIKSIPAFKSIKTPMIQIEQGWIPDFTSRYFTEDFPFGLRFIKELAHNHDINIPIIDKVYKWGMLQITK